MTFPPAAATRQLKHRRRIDGQVFAHDDGLWEVDATLVDPNLMQDYRKAMHQRVGGVRGCTHITEFAQVLPTAVMLAFAIPSHPTED